MDGIHTLDCLVADRESPRTVATVFCYYAALINALIFT